MRADGVTGPIARAVMRGIEADLERDPASLFAQVAIGATWLAWVEKQWQFLTVRIEAIQDDRSVEGRRA